MLQSRYPATYLQPASARAGFTLVELLIAMVMVSVMLALAAPTFENTLRSNRQSTSLNNVVGMLALARGEAVTRTVPVSACSTADPYAAGGPTCRGTNVWDDGWLIFADDGAGAGGVARNGQIEGSEVLIRLGDGASTGVSIRSFNFPRVSAVTFEATGLSTGRGTMVICDQRGASGASAIVVNLSGQARLSRDNLAGDGIVEDDANNAVGCP